MLCLLSSAVLAQPLQDGVSDAEGRRFVLDQGVVRVFSPEFKEESTFDGATEALFQGGQGWSSSFLVLTESGLARVATEASADASPTVIVAGENLTVEPWGDVFLVHAANSSELVVVSPTSETRLATSGTIQTLAPLSSELAVVGTDRGIDRLHWNADSAVATAEPVVLPFPAQGARLAVDGGRAIVSSATSPKVVELTGKRRLLTLPASPTLGLRLLEDGSLVAAGPRSLMLLLPGQDQGRELFRPQGITEAAFAGWPMFVFDKQLTIFLQENGRLRALTYQSKGGVPTDLFPTGELHALLVPKPTESGRPLMFLQTQSQEPKLDKKGRPVLDLASGEPVMLTVTGHRLYLWESSGRWSMLSQQPRGALVGPIQRVGDRVVYATQTEPLRQPGRRLEADSRYPYPAVILHGRSLTDPSQEWQFDKPRGEAPSKGRLPEHQWPLLSEQGPLLLTSEDHRLLAIDPSDGSLAWSSDTLSMDESSPLMLRWQDRLGLLTAKSTGRGLVIVDPSNGAILDEATLNEVFFRERWRHLLGVIIVCAALAYYIYVAGKRSLYIRRIAGLQALDEAVGRATEMGKPVLYVVGLADVDDIQTMASLSILSHVARKTAEYDTPIVTTTSRAVAFSAAQEIVRDAFSVAGHPDAFSVESVRYISDDQFGYTAGVDGIMVREKPAANFYIGKFYAESLILAETGHATGSIQIAGTAEPSQVPFFVAACDYTLIGEELFAASAYLSRDPLQVGSLRGQDVGKAIIMVLLVVCSLLVSLGIDWDTLSAATGVSLP